MREQIQRQIQRTRLKNNKLAKLGDAIYEDDDVKLQSSKLNSIQRQIQRQIQTQTQTQIKRQLQIQT